MNPSQKYIVPFALGVSLTFGAALQAAEPAAPAEPAAKSAPAAGTGRTIDITQAQARAQWRAAERRMVPVLPR